MQRPGGRGMGRRRFLAAAGGLLGLPALARARQVQGPVNGFTLGVQSWSFRQCARGPDEALRFTRDLGLGAIEFAPGPHARATAKPEQFAALKRLCADRKVTPVAYGVVRFTKDHAENARLFELGRALGVTAFSADPDPDSFDSLDKLVAEHKIGVAIHPHGAEGKPRPTKLHRWYSAAVILKAVKDHNPLIGSCLDTGHLIRAGLLGERLDPAREIRVMGARNLGLHLKDHDNKQDVDVVFGKGALDLPAVLRALKDVHFKGWVSIEYEAEPENPLPAMRACVEEFRRAAKGPA